MTDEAEELVAAVAEALKGCTTNATRVDAIVGLITEREAERFVWEVYPRNTHAAVETVHAYGLTIGVDANGYASRVAFEDGADTDE